MPAIPVVVKEGRQPPKVKTQKVVIEKTTPPPPPVYICPMCGREYATKKENFALTNTPATAHGGNFTSMCRVCIEKFFNDHIKKYDNDVDKAVRRVCEWLDAYYSRDIWKGLGDEATITGYLARIRQYTKTRSKTWEDTLDEEEEERKSAKIVTIGNTELTEEELEEAIDIFGEGFEDKAYEYMMRIYRGYISPLGDTVTAGQLKSARFLAALEYRCMEAIKNDKPNASALSTTLRKAISESGFDTVVKNDDDSVPPIGILLKQIETFTPAQYLKNSPYKDVDKQGEYYERFCERPLMNLLNRGSLKKEDALSITDEEAAAFDSLGGVDDG